MYVRGTPPANLSGDALISWLLLELAAIEQELSRVDTELTKLKESQNAA